MGRTQKRREEKLLTLSILAALVGLVKVLLEIILLLLKPKP